MNNYLLLWGTLASYSLAFINELAENAEVTLVYSDGHIHPLSNQISNKVKKIIVNDYKHCDDELECIKGVYDAVIFVGWMSKSYINFVRATTTIRLKICMVDTYWRCSLKFILGSIYVKLKYKFVDVFWVNNGLLALKLAKKISQNDFIQGLYSYDSKIFYNKSYIRDRSILYVGRISKEKNIIGLIKAYEQYKNIVKDDFMPLKIVGEIQSESIFELIKSTVGVEYLGVMNPIEISEVMNKSTFFVLPSIKEPWGVVVQEALACGMFVVVSEKCGSKHLISHNFNGLVTGSKINELKKSLLNCHKNINILHKNISSGNNWTPERQVKMLNAYIDYKK